EAGPLHIGGRAITAAVGWSLLAWVPLGLHVWVLTWSVGGDPVSSVGPAVGAYALAWTLGVLVIFAPAGIGVREVVLVVALAPVVGAGAALVVAVLSSLAMILADLAWAGGALGLSRPARPRCDAANVILARKTRRAGHD